MRFLRTTEPGEEQRATWLELFFDLVFVFAVTQLSHHLVEHLTWTGVAETLFLLLVIWWAWTYTTWMTNWYDPDSPPVRVVLIAVMLAGLLMAIAIPDAFGERGLLFGASYAALHLVRNAFVTAVAPRGTAFRASQARILAWALAAAPLWVAGGLVEGDTRVALWLVALAIDYGGPYARYWLPGFGATPTTDWSIEGAHFAERFQLFVIIALGESVVITGATASELELTTGRILAVGVALIGTAALWWLYFDYVARIAQRRLQLAEDGGRLARDAYTYLHLPLVAGIIVSAVADEIVIAHPDHHLGAPELAAVAAGPVLYLLGHVGFRLRMAGSISGKRVLAAAAVVAVTLAGASLPAVALSALVTGVLVVLIAVETIAGMRRRARQQPSPLEQLEEERARRADKPSLG
jgi:low temperature requirement protein LtrA